MTAPCLILVDWQKGFRDGDYWGPRNNPDAEHNAERLLRHWRVKGWPVIHVRHGSTEAKSVLRPELPGNEIEDFVRPAENEPVYAKTVNSAFIGTTLEHDLRERGLSHLVFTGVSTDHCVNTTVRMAANLGFAATVVADACYAFERTTLDGRRIDAQSIHEAHLASLAGEFARISNTADVILE